jgi:hypothetical protein
MDKEIDKINLKLLALDKKIQRINKRIANINDLLTSKPGESEVTRPDILNMPRFSSFIYDLNEEVD